MVWSSSGCPGPGLQQRWCAPLGPGGRVGVSGKGDVEAIGGGGYIGDVKRRGDTDVIHANNKLTRISFTTELHII